MKESKNIERLHGILKGLQSNSISKGIIDDFTYNNKLEIAKSGKDMKVLLAKVVAGLQVKCDEKKAQLTILQSLIKAGGSTADPLQNPSSYLLQGLRKTAFSYLPKMFSYEQKYGPDTMNKTYAQSEPVSMGGDYDSSDLNKVSNAEVKPDGKVKKYMDSYNECVRAYISSEADKLFLGTLIESIKDTQQIKLTGSILKLLV